MAGRLKSSKRHITKFARRRPIGFGWCLLLGTVAAIILLRFFWPAAIMLFAFAGVTDPSTMLGLIVGVVILGAAALWERWNGRLL
jgi:hypothetical protein